MTAQLLPSVWIMRTIDGWYPIQPSDKCRPREHATLNPHVVRIEDVDGTPLWERAFQ